MNAVDFCSFARSSLNWPVNFLSFWVRFFFHSPRPSMADFNMWKLSKSSLESSFLSWSCAVFNLFVFLVWHSIVSFSAELEIDFRENMLHVSLIFGDVHEWISIHDRARGGDYTAEVNFNLKKKVADHHEDFTLNCISLIYIAHKIVIFALTRLLNPPSYRLMSAAAAAQSSWCENWKTLIYREAPNNF